MTWPPATTQSYFARLLNQFAIGNQQKGAGCRRRNRSCAQRDVILAMCQLLFANCSRRGRGFFDELGCFLRMRDVGRVGPRDVGAKRAVTAFCGDVILYRVLLRRPRSYGPPPMSPGSAEATRTVPSPTRLTLPWIALEPLLQRCESRRVPAPVGRASARGCSQAHKWWRPCA